MIRFSVVIPVYKVEEYLDQCVQSVLNQTYRHLEVILVDDGSPDRCGELCDLWAQKDERIRVLHQENGGLSAARNAGIRHATGDYLLFLDSDDWWENSDVLAGIAQQLVKTPVDVLSFNYRKSYDGVLQPPYFDPALPSSDQVESLSQIVQQDRWINGACNKAVSRSLLTDNELFFRLGITAEDIDWTLRLALAAESFAFGNVCVFVYRQHGASISHSLSLKKIQTLSANIRVCIQLLEADRKDKANSLTPYVAYQYGTLIYNVANLPGPQRKTLLADIRDMQWLLSCSVNHKVRLIYRCSRIVGLSATLVLLRMRGNLQRRMELGG